LSSKKVDEISPGVNFINILRVAFFADILAQKITKLKVTREKLLNSLLYKKCACKKLMKLILSTSKMRRNA